MILLDLNHVFPRVTRKVLARFLQVWVFPAGWINAGNRSYKGASRMCKSIRNISAYAAWKTIHV